MALILSRADLQQCLTMAQAISAMRLAFSALYNAQAQLTECRRRKPLRLRHGDVRRRSLWGVTAPSGGR